MLETRKASLLLREGVRTSQSNHTRPQSKVDNIPGPETDRVHLRYFITCLDALQSQGVGFTELFWAPLRVHAGLGRSLVFSLNPFSGTVTAEALTRHKRLFALINRALGWPFGRRLSTSFEPTADILRASNPGAKTARVGN